MTDVPPHIVEAARHVLAEDGLAAATLERISTEAGVSRMTLHRRGVSKADILRAIAEDLERDYRDSMWPALVARGSGRARLELALDALCEVTERNLALLSALSTASRAAIYHADEDDVGDGALTRDVFVEPLERLLLDGAADGTLRLIDPTETATVLFNVIGHTYTHLRADHRWDRERARAGVVGLVLGGVIAVGRDGGS